MPQSATRAETADEPVTVEATDRHREAEQRIGDGAGDRGRSESFDHDERQPVGGGSLRHGHSQQNHAEKQDSPVAPQSYRGIIAGRPREQRVSGAGPAEDRRRFICSPADDDRRDGEMQDEGYGVGVQRDTGQPAAVGGVAVSS